MSSKLKTELKGKQNWNVTKTEMSPKIKYHQNWNVTKTKIVLLNWTFKFNSKTLALIALALSSVFSWIQGYCFKIVFFFIFSQNIKENLLLLGC